MNRAELKPAILSALKAKAGSAHYIEVAKHIWKHHENDLRASGDFFYQWQYEMRWAALSLRNEGALVLGEGTKRGVWSLPKVTR